jgi:hypothetical protein
MTKDEVVAEYVNLVIQVTTGKTLLTPEVEKRLQDLWTTFEGHLLNRWPEMALCNRRELVANIVEDRGWNTYDRMQALWSTVGMLQAHFAAYEQ